MSSEGTSPGCRDAAVATGLLVGFAIVFMTAGLIFINQDGCVGACETLGLTLTYAGLPVSALIGVIFGELPLAWPLDITFWVVVGFGLARLAARRRRPVTGLAVVGVLAALIYGLVLSSLVELVI